LPVLIRRWRLSMLPALLQVGEQEVVEHIWVAVCLVEKAPHEVGASLGGKGLPKPDDVPAVGRRNIWGHAFLPNSHSADRAAWALSLTTATPGAQSPPGWPPGRPGHLRVRGVGRQGGTGCPGTGDPGTDGSASAGGIPSPCSARCTQASPRSSAGQSA